MFILAGIFFLGLGGELTITQGVKLAELLNVSTTVIGMVVIAIGTHLPECVTSIIVAMREEADLCVGNVVGSNIFNILLVHPSVLWFTRYQYQNTVQRTSRLTNTVPLQSHPDRSRGISQQEAAKRTIRTMASDIAS